VKQVVDQLRLVGCLDERGKQFRRRVDGGLRTHAHDGTAHCSLHHPMRCSGNERQDERKDGEHGLSASQSRGGGLNNFLRDEPFFLLFRIQHTCVCGSRVFANPLIGLIVATRARRDELDHEPVVKRGEPATGHDLRQRRVRRDHASAGVRVPARGVQLTASRPTSEPAMNAYC
jgi:hypothetical protein